MNTHPSDNPALLLQANVGSVFKQGQASLPVIHRQIKLAGGQATVTVLFGDGSSKVATVSADETVPYLTLDDIVFEGNSLGRVSRVLVDDAGNEQPSYSYQTLEAPGTTYPADAPKSRVSYNPTRGGTFQPSAAEKNTVLDRTVYELASGEIFLVLRTQDINDTSIHRTYSSNNISGLPMLPALLAVGDYYVSPDSSNLLSLVVGRRKRSSNEVEIVLASLEEQPKRSTRVFATPPSSADTADIAGEFNFAPTAPSATNGNVKEVDSLKNARALIASSRNLSVHLNQSGTTYYRLFYPDRPGENIRVQAEHGSFNTELVNDVLLPHYAPGDFVYENDAFHDLTKIVDDGGASVITHALTEPAIPEAPLQDDGLALTTTGQTVTINGEEEIVVSRQVISDFEWGFILRMLTLSNRTFHIKSYAAQPILGGFGDVIIHRSAGRWLYATGMYRSYTANSGAPVQLMTAQLNNALE